MSTAPLRLGKYELGERLGQGGMAEVYRATIRGAAGFEKQVALKMIRENCAEDPSFVTRFVEEAGLSALLDHPNLVATYDFGCIGGRYFLAMELVDGLPLSELLRSRRALGETLALHVVAETAAALDYAWSARGKNGEPLRLVHRDVTPSNVLVSRHGQVKLSDFGIAHFAGRTTATAAGSLTGKFAYMSPEQAWARDLDARSDVFALGLMLYELATGERALVGDTDIALLEAARVAKLRALDSLSEGLRELIVAATRVAKEDRIASASDMRRRCLALSSAAQTEPLAAIVRELGVTSPTATGAPALANTAPSPSATEVGTPVAITLESDRAPREPIARGSTWRVPLGIAATLALLIGGGVALSLRTHAGDANGEAPASVARAITPPRTSIAPPPASIAPPPAIIDAPPAVAPAAARATSSAQLLPVARHASPPREKARAGVEPVVLRVQVTPWAEVFVDGKTQGDTPFAPLEFPAGAHTIEVRHPQLGSQTQHVVLRAGEPKKVVFDLTKAAP